MKPWICVFFVVVFLFQNCSSEKDEPNPEPLGLVTVHRDANHDAGLSVWIFVSDDNGDILDATPIQPDSTITLTAKTPPDFVNVTIYYEPNVSVMNHDFYTWANVPRGEEIIIKNPSHSSLPPVKGTATINIQNCNPFDFFVMSDGIGYSQAECEINPPISAVIDLRRESARVLVDSHNPAGEPVYGWIDNVTNGGTYTVDYNDLTPYPKTVTIQPAASIAIEIDARNTADPEPGYRMFNTGYPRNSGESAAKFGYVDGFEDYRLWGYSTKDMTTYYHYTYFEVYGASIPLQITLPQNSFTVSTSSIADFTFNYSSTSTFSIHFWRKGTNNQSTNWIVYSDKSAIPPFKKLPEEFTALYPSISLNDLKYYQSSFMKYEDGYSYKQFRENTIAGTKPNRVGYFSDVFIPK